VLEPRLEVAGAGLDDGARREAVARELRERNLGEVVEGSVAVLTGRSDVDMRAAGIAVLEQGSRSMTAPPVMPSRPGSMPRSLRTPTS
jgi:hypothetical protein